MQVVLSPIGEKYEQIAGVNYAIIIKVADYSYIHGDKVDNIGCESISYGLHPDSDELAGIHECQIKRTTPWHNFRARLRRPFHAVEMGVTVDTHREYIISREGGDYVSPGRGGNLRLTRSVPME